MSNHPSVSSGVIRSIGLCVSSAALGFIACKLLKRIGSKQNDDPKDLWDTELKQMIAERKAEEAKLMETLKLDPNQTNLSHAEFALASLISVSKENVIDEKVCGCDSILDQLNLQVVLPFQLASTKMAVPSSLYVAPKGILLFGPNGCGKRMIARAIAKEANAHFLAFNNAFCFGDPMYMKSLFTLSEKIQPCVIFIDDIDLVFPRHLKSFKFQIQFFSQWEEFMSSSNSNLVVIGATSRMQSIDGSVLSRFPLKMHVPLPDQAAREKILRMLLWNEDLEDDFKFAKVALETEKLSGSELKEVVHLVLLSRYQQVVKSMVNASLSSQSLQSLTDSTERGQSIKLSHKDIIQAFHQFKTTSAERFSDETIMTEEVIPVD